MIAGGLLLAALSSCGGEQSVAGKSAVAFREAQKRGESFGSAGHAQGAVTSGGSSPEVMPAEHAPAGAGAPAGEAMRHGGALGSTAHLGAVPGDAGEETQGGHVAGGHAGHAPPSPGKPAAMVPAPAAVPPGQPAATLRPDAIDAPAATSVIEAERSAAMSREMAGGGHGVGTYRQLDAGRGRQTDDGPEGPRPLGETMPQQHHHPAPPPPARRQA